MKRSRIAIICLCLLVVMTVGCNHKVNSNKETGVVNEQVSTMMETDDTKKINVEETSKIIENTQETESTQQSEIDESITLMMVGDVLLHTPVSDSGKLADGSYDYNHLFTHVKSETKAADIALVNQEVILGGTELGLSGYPCFNGAYEVGDALVNNGFDIILHATNHTLDKGEKGVRNCLDFWKTNYPAIKVAGINESQSDQDSQIVITEQKGIRIAVLNYTYGTNGIEVPKDAPYLVNYIDKDKIKQDVELAKTMSDFIVVCPHWGIEYQHTQSEEQGNLAQYLSDIGVDLVIGTHPHVIEPVEWITGTDGKQTLVYYSLGNFVNATSGTGDGVADRMLGAMAKVTIKRQENGEAEIISHEAIPIVSHLKSGVQGITVYPLNEYTPELEAENEIVKQDPNFSIEYITNMWNDVME